MPHYLCHLLRLRYDVYVYFGSEIALYCLRVQHFAELWPLAKMVLMDVYFGTCEVIRSFSHLFIALLLVSRNHALVICDLPELATNRSQLVLAI